MLLNSLKSVCVKFKRDENGATAIEYGLIAGLIAVAIIVAVGVIGDDLNTTFETIHTKLTTPAAPANQ